MNMSPVPDDTDVLVRQVMELTDPVRGTRPRPLPMTAAQIRDQVEATRRYRLQTRFRRLLRRPVAEYRPREQNKAQWLPVSLVLGTVMVVTIGVAWFVKPSSNMLAEPVSTSSEPNMIEPVAGPGLLGFELAETTAPALDVLRQLADDTSTQAETLADGRYTHVHLQAWSANMTARQAPVVAEDLEVWWAADRSGHQRQTLLPPQPGGFVLAEWLNALPLAARPQITEFNPGEYAVAVENPSSHPAVLAGQLAFHQSGQRPELLARAVADMYRYHCLNAERRAAALHVLADTEALVYHGQVIDRAGRQGAAVSVDSGTPETGVFRDVLVFDPDTGKLLSHEQIVLASPPRSPVRPLAVTSYVLYLACELTDERP